MTVKQPTMLDVVPRVVSRRIMTDEGASVSIALDDDEEGAEKAMSSFHT